MSTEENKAIVRRLLEKGYAGELGFLEELVAADYRDHCVWKNRQGLVRMLTAYGAAFAELKCIVTLMIAEEDKVAACCQLVGAGRGETKTINATSLFRIREGKVVEHWGHSDSFF